jgi:hypothetical protein
MMVCDICWSPTPEYSGVPRVDNRITGNSGFLFGPGTPAKGAIDTRRIELCKTCLGLMQHRDFQALADRAHQALMRQVESPGACA